jgi:hypothetical protein
MTALLPSRETHLAAFFHPGQPPALAESHFLLTGHFNVLATHLEAIARADLLEALLSISAGLRDGGRLAIELASPPGELLLLLETAGFFVVRSVQIPDGWLVMAQKSEADMLRGLSRVQSILAQDRKTATYKLALIRALCRIGRTEPHAVIWANGVVHVPLRAIAVAWVRFYWPLVNRGTFVAQIKGEKPVCAMPLAVRKLITSLAETYSPTGLPLFLAALDSAPTAHDDVLRKIRDTIVKHPIQYAGSGQTPVFGYSGKVGERRDSFGWVIVPEAVWLDLVRFDHWIEDSVVMRWAELTADMNANLTAADVLPLLLDAGEDVRDTTMIRQAVVSISRTLGRPIECVWTGRSVSEFEVDHVLPYSVWRNNDLWNLLPADKTVNHKKKDSLPTHALLIDRESAIRDYWRAYGKLWGNRFSTQVTRALGPAVGSPGWDAAAFAGLVESVERLAATRGLRRWEP